MDWATECPLVSSFLARQGIIAAAGCFFFLVTWLRKLQGVETRDLRTFCADVSKQVMQQGFGGLLMAAAGVALAQHEGRFDALAWYGAEYPFEIVLTTFFTRVFRQLSEHVARNFYVAAENQSSAWSEIWLPMLNMGRYGPTEQEPFRCQWYVMQMVQAVLLIGVPARLCSVGLILTAMLLPEAWNPVRGIASLYYESDLTCAARTALTLYIVPLAGDAVQFVIIDLIQKAATPKRNDQQVLLGTPRGGDVI